MPFIQIKSLPFEESKSISDILCEVNKEFSIRLDVPLEHVHATWEFFQPGYYAKGDVAPQSQPDKFHALFVELLTPDFNSAETCALMLEVLAASLAKHVRIPLSNIFIYHRQARSGMVFDDGRIVRWQPQPDEQSGPDVAK